MVSSVIHYKPQEEQARRVRQKWIDGRGAEAFQIPKRYGCVGDTRWDRLRSPAALFGFFFLSCVRLSFGLGLFVRIVVFVSCVCCLVSILADYSFARGGWYL